MSSWPSIRQGLFPLVRVENKRYSCGSPSGMWKKILLGLVPVLFGLRVLKWFRLSLLVDLLTFRVLSQAVNQAIISAELLAMGSVLNSFRVEMEGFMSNKRPHSDSKLRRKLYFERISADDVDENAKRTGLAKVR
ncbi:hypothetical protein CBL_04190 [Carabus blaptoides fortunei]